MLTLTFFLLWNIFFINFFLFERNHRKNDERQMATFQIIDAKKQKTAANARASTVFF